MAPASGLGPPRSSLAAASRHAQGKALAKIPHPSRIKNAHRFGNTSKARSRGSNEQARGPKLATNRCRRTIPCRRPCRNKYPHTAPQTRHGRQPRGAARHQAQVEPLADFQRERPAVPRTSCLSRNTSSTKPLALSLGWHSGPDPVEHVQHNPHNTATTKRSAPPRREGAGIAALPRCDSVRRLRMEAACSTADERALHRGAGRGGCRLGRSQSEGGRVGETKATDGWLWDQTRFLRSRTICDGAAVTDIGVAVSVLGSAARRAGHLYPGLRLTLPPRLRAGGEQ